ncbi:AAA family ATPase [Solwaraspora sp. WMMD406]|uniref:AAA family ATPase n=1 Tax=Solwaraspora sp. WMMD406 TaxID=3016095 RepID=UPI002415A193|nr:AAA family ATPase [Solwaraspora sp. WMMD406]MDG4762667.1 AAA family ATPase [Solwaraspora sp. WMMD406]
MDTAIELLGPMAVRCAGTVHHLQSAQTRVAFARLVLAGPEGVTRHELADVIWPGELPPTWASALRTLVSRLRAFVGPLQAEETNPLVKRGGRYVLALGKGVLVDVRYATRSVAAAQQALNAGDLAGADRLATEAADRLRFPFLSEHEGDWVGEQRERLTECLVTALEIASRAATGTGDHNRAALLAEEATTRAPERESAHRCLMAVREAMGNRGEALRAYQRLRRYLAEELGVDPSPETEAAYLALLGPSSAPTAPGTRTTAEHRPVPFVGRHHEMAMLTGAWARASRGSRQFVLVTGESGIGKTRLLREAGEAMATEGGLLLVGRCDEGAMIPYQPFVEALDGYVAASPDDPLEAVSPAVRGPLRLLLPSLGGPCPPGELPEQSILFAALTQLLLVAASERPCALLIDDVHWADPQTAALLRHVLRTTADARLCVVAAARNDLPTSDRRRVRASLDEAMLPFEHVGEGTEIALGGLDFASTRALTQKLDTGSIVADGATTRESVDTAGTDADPIRRAHARSGGNPFMLVEMLRHKAGSDSVPPAVARLVAAKQAAIGQNATRLLQVAAVTGPSFAFDAVAGAAGLDVLSALDALEALLEVGILTEVTAAGARHPYRPAIYEFRHTVVRQAVDEQVSDARRRHVTSWQQAEPGATSQHHHELGAVK